MDNTETINILSLCTGYGGLELGLSRALAGVFRVVTVEVEAYALANLAAKAQKGKLAIEAMWPDLKTFPAERFRGCFDFILAGYPCQPFSVAGKRKGTDDPRHLWPYIARIVQAVRPVWCFFENVPGHLTIGYPEVYRSLRNMGYSVEAGIFSAAEVGAPHRRERLFILAKSGRAGAGRICGTPDRQYRSQDVRQENGQTRPTRAQPASELENTKRLRRRRGNNGKPAGQGRPLQTEGPSQLADTRQHDGQRLQQKEQPKELPEKLSGRTQLADRDGAGRQEQHRAEPTRQEHPAIECGRWPSRPGQPQYEWEEARTVVDSKSKRPGREQKGICEKNGRQGRALLRQLDGTEQGQTQSSVGRAVNGPNCRVDRLRLLGNGVVPMQAEKAFRYLMGNIE